MDVKTVCLGLLTFGDASGYDIKKHFEATVDHFFATGFGSIYPALASLADEGLVTCTTVPQEGRPERKVYRITPAGDVVLRRALASEEPNHRVRSELLALLYFAHLVPPQRISQRMDERIAAMDVALRQMRSSACPAEHRWPSSVRFVQGFGAALLEAGINYMKQNRHLLEDGRGEAPAGPDSGPTPPTHAGTRRSG
jgi:DNA-binding PadR family transcriptional regulator